MQTFKTLSDAIALAEFAHRNQQDKAGMPYIDHPKRVLASVQGQGAQPYVQMAAVLHDVVEDTPISLNMLSLLGFSEAVVNLVDLLTRTDDVTPEEYYAKIGRSPDARMIKFADIADNTQEWRLSYLDEDTQLRLKRKYNKALREIREARCNCGRSPFHDMLCPASGQVLTWDC